MIDYRDSTSGITADRLHGFFVGWLHPPSPETHLRLLAESDHIVLALEEDTGQVVGFITAISDGVLSAYIPFLEVLPAYQGQGIGRELVQRMLGKLHGLYMVDLLCDPDLQPFYARLGMRPASGMMLRDYNWQAGPDGRDLAPIETDALLPHARRECRIHLDCVEGLPHNHRLRGALPM